MYQRRLMDLPGVVTSGVADVAAWRQRKEFVAPDYIEDADFVICVGVADLGVPTSPMFLEDVPVVAVKRGRPRRV